MSVRYNDLIVAGRNAFVYSGTNSPNDSVGTNGDAYIQYDDGTRSPTAITYSLGTIESIDDVENFVTSATVNYTIVPTYHYAFAPNEHGTPENYSKIVTFDQNVETNDVIRTGAFADATHTDIVVNWSLKQLGMALPTIKIRNTDATDVAVLALTATRNSAVQGDIVWSCDLSTSTATIEGSNLVFAQAFDGDVILTATADNATDTKTIHVVCNDPVTATTYVLNIISPIEDQEYSATSAVCNYTVIPVYHFASKPTQTGLAVKRAQTVSFTENSGDSFVIRDGVFTDADNVTVNWSLVQYGKPEIVITNTDVSGVSTVKLTATRNNAVEGDIVWASSLPADTARIDGNNLLLLQAYTGPVTLVATADNATAAKTINVVCDSPITATTYALGTVNPIDDQVYSATSTICEYTVIPTYYTSAITIIGTAINRSKTVSFEENIDTNNITRSGSFNDAAYTGVVVNWSLVQKGVPSLTITNTDVTDVTVLALTATRNDAVEGETVWACSLPVETAVIDGTQIDGVNLVFLKPYDGDIILTAMADNAADTKTIHATCTDVVTATTYALGTVSPTDDQEYSATSANIQYTIIPTYYFASKPSVTGTPIQCTQSVIFPMNTTEAIVARSGSFTNPKYTDITVNWSLNHLGMPILTITNTGATDASALTLTYSANSFVRGDVVWACDLDETTVKIEDNILTFLKHYEGDMKLIATADNAFSSKVIKVLCDETPTAITYTLGSVSPIEDAAYSATSATVEYVVIPTYYYERRPDTIGASILRTKTVSFAENTGYTTIERTGLFDDADYSGITVDWSLNQLGLPLLVITNSDEVNVSVIALTANRSEAVEGNITWSCDLPAETAKIEGSNLVFLKAYDGSVALTATADNATANKTINVTCVAPVTASTYASGTVMPIEDQVYSATSAVCEYTITPTYYTSVNTITGADLDRSHNVEFVENTGETTVIRSGSFTDTDYTSVTIDWSLNHLAQPQLVITNTDVFNVSVVELTATRNAAVEGDIVWYCDLTTDVAKIEGSNLVFLQAYDGAVTLSAQTDNASDTKTINASCTDPITATIYVSGTALPIADQEYSATSANCNYTITPVYSTVNTNITGADINCSDVVTFEENTGDTVVVRSGSFVNLNYKTVTIDWTLNQNPQPILTITNTGTTDTAVLALTYTANTYVKGNIVWSCDLPVTTAKINGNTLTFLRHYEGEVTLTATADNVATSKAIAVTCTDPVTSTTYVLESINPIANQVYSATSAICEYTVTPVYHYESREDSTGDTIQRSETVSFDENSGDTNVIRSGVFTDADSITVNWSLTQYGKPEIIITNGDVSGVSIIELTATRNNAVEGDIVWASSLPADTARIDGTNLVLLKPYTGPVTLVATADNAAAAKTINVSCTDPVTASTYVLSAVASIEDQEYSATSATCEYTVAPTYYTSATIITGTLISRSKLVEFEENTGETTVARSGSFDDASYSPVTVNWSLNQLAKPELVITNTDVSGISIIELTATRNDAVKGDIVWSSDLSSDVAMIEDDVLIFLKHYDGDILLTAKADNAIANKTIHAVCTEPVTAITYALSAITPIEEQEYSATSVDVKYTVIPTYYFASKPSMTGKLINSSKSVTFEQNTGETTIVRSGSFDDVKHDNITIDWSFNHLGVPVIVITNTGTTDTTVLTLTCTANANVKGAIVWSCNLDTSTVKIDGDTLTFLKHYESTIKLTATADNAEASKVIDVTCDESVTSTTYVLGTINPIDDQIYSATSATVEYTIIPILHYKDKTSKTGIAVSRTNTVTFEQNTGDTDVIRSSSFTDADYTDITVNWSLVHKTAPVLTITNTDATDVTVLPLMATRNSSVEGDTVWSCDLSSDVAKIEGTNLVFLQAYNSSVTLTATADNASDTKTINITCIQPVTATTYELGTVDTIDDQVCSAISATCEYTVVPTYEYASGKTETGIPINRSKDVAFEENTTESGRTETDSFVDETYTDVTVNWSLYHKGIPVITITVEDTSGQSVIQLTATKNEFVEGDIEWSSNLPEDTAIIEGDNLVFLKPFDGDVTITVTTENGTTTKIVHITCDDPVTGITYYLDEVLDTDNAEYSATNATVKYTVKPVYTYVAKAAQTGNSLNCSQTVEFDVNNTYSAVTRSGSFVDAKNITVDWSLQQDGIPVLTITNTGTTDTAVLVLTYTGNTFVKGTVNWSTNLPLNTAKIEGSNLVFVKHYEGDVTLFANADNATANKVIPVKCDEVITSTTYALVEVLPIEDQEYSATSATCEYTIVPVYHYKFKPDVSGDSLSRTHTVEFEENTAYTHVIRTGEFTDEDNVTVPWSLYQKNDGLTTFIYEDGTVVRKDLTYITSGDSSASTLVECIVGDNAKELSSFAFSGRTKMSAITLSNSVTRIGDRALTSCYGLTEITIPKSVTTIDYAAFWACTGLTSITLSEGVTNLVERTFANCYSVTEFTIPNSVTSVGSDLLNGCRSLTDVTIGSGVTTWSGYYQFANCSALTSVTIVDGATKIFDTEFWNLSSMTQVYIPSSVTSIGASAFANCYNLTSITIPENVTSIGASAFANCRTITSLTIPNSVATIESGIAVNCYSLTDLTIGSGVTASTDYNRSPFSGCSALTSVTIVDGATKIFDYEFYNLNSLQEVDMPDSVTSIGTSAFQNCHNLTEIKIPENVTSIGAYAFANCYNLTEIQIPENVTSIEIGTFENCRGLTEIVIPNKVTTVGKAAFYNCRGMTDITIGSGITDWYIPTGTSYTYLPLGGCSALTSVTIVDGATKIFDTEFYNLNSLQEVDMPDSIKSIGNSAFAMATSLESIEIGSDTIKIGDKIFYNCTKLANISYGNTKSQWISVMQKGTDWNYNVPATCIHCSDGDVVLS